MKSTLTSALLLVLASFIMAPEPVAAAPAASESATASLLSFEGSSNTRRTKKLRSGKPHRSSAARAHAKRHRRSGW